MKPTKPFHCNNLPYFIFQHLLFDDATIDTSTKGHVFTRPLLCPLIVEANVAGVRKLA